MLPVLCSRIKITYKTPKGNLRTKNFPDELYISFRGELISKTRCNLPCKIVGTIGSYDYDEYHFELTWECRDGHESEGPYQTDEEAFLYLINENWNRIQQPIIAGGS